MSALHNNITTCMAGVGTRMDTRAFIGRRADNGQE